MNVKQKTALWSIDSGYFFPLREDETKQGSDDDDDENMNDEL